MAISRWQKVQQRTGWPLTFCETMAVSMVGALALTYGPWLLFKAVQAVGDWLLKGVG